MTTVTKFYNFCLDENIEGLNELKKAGLTLTADQRRKALTDNINKGNLETIKWLFNNNTINIKKEKLVQQACLLKKFNVAEWLCNNFKINITKIKETMKNKIKKDDELRIWLEKKVKKEKIITDKFRELCKGSDINKIDEYYQKYKYLVTKDMALELINNNFTIEFIKWVAINKLWNDDPFPLVLKSLLDDQLSVFKWFYRTLMFRISQIGNYEKLVEKIDKTTDTYKFVIESIEHEKIFEQLLELCKTGQLIDIQTFYLENLSAITGQLIIHSIGDVLDNCRTNIEAFKWFVKLCKVKTNDLKLFLYESIPDGNKELINFCKSKFTPSQIKKLDIDIPLLLALENDNYDIVEYMLDNGFKLKKHMNCIFNCLIASNRLKLLKNINDEYHCLDDLENYEHTFISACALSKLKVIKWLYGLKNNVFEDQYDILYEMAVEESFNTDNNVVLKWLVGLYDRFLLLTNHQGQIMLVDSVRDDEYYDSEDDEIYNEIYDVILDNKKRAFELLGITQTCKNEENDDCIICKTKPKNLVKLNCGHFGCITCLSTWYKTNPELCVYCKKPIQWSEAMKVEQ